MLIGISGRKSSGKSTASNFLLKNNFQKASFAAGLKEYVGKIYHWEQQDLNTQFGKESLLQSPVKWTEKECEELSILTGQKLKFKEYKSFSRRREAMQHIGTEVLRDHDPDFHLKEFKKRFSSGNYVCDDVRFFNELNMIQDMNGHSFFIVRPYFWDYSNHSSEITLNYTHFQKVLLNNTTLENFEESVYNIFNNIDSYSLVIPASSMLIPNEESAFKAGLLNKYTYFDDEYNLKYYNPDLSFVFDKHLSFSKNNISIVIEDLKLWDIEPFKFKDFKVPDVILNKYELTRSWISGLLYLELGRVVFKDYICIGFNKKVAEFVFNWLNIDGEICSENGLSNYYMIKYSKEQWQEVKSKLKAIND